MKRLAVAVLFGVLAGCSENEELFPPPIEDSTSVDVTSDDTLAPDAGSDAVDSTVDDTAFGIDSGTDAIDANDTAIDSGAPDTFVADTFVPDTFVPDTEAPDTYVPDTFVPDTEAPDTYVPDTFVPDTFVPDTFVPDTAMTDVSDTSDVGSAPLLPGAECTGTLTDTALVNLYATKTVTGTPSFILGGSTTARKLGTYTSSLYSRSCASTTGCTAWVAAAQPAYETFYSINTGVRDGSLYLWSPSSGSHKLAIVSNTIGTDCKGWTEGIGTMVRSGDNASVTLATSVEDNCTAGADPVFYFQEIDLYDPTGIVTDHCMKLTYSKQRNRVDIGPGAYTYDEYMVVYDATY